VCVCVYVCLFTLSVLSYVFLRAVFTRFSVAHSFPIEVVVGALYRIGKAHFAVGEYKRARAELKAALGMLISRLAFILLFPSL